MSTEKTHILVVDDEPKFVKILQFNLENCGYKVSTAHDGPSAIKLISKEQPELILLDILMPDMDGLETCQNIRMFSKVPIILLTALSEDENKVRGLNIGADDYITKPFSTEEMLARVQAILRRIDTTRKRKETPSTIKKDNLEIDFTKQHVFLSGEEVTLTRTEYQLLAALAKNAGHVLSFDHLLGEIWGEPQIGENQLVWKTIHRLRRKIETDSKKPKYIVSIPGTGYLFYE